VDIEGIQETFKLLQQSVVVLNRSDKAGRSRPKLNINVRGRPSGVRISLDCRRCGEARKPLCGWVALTLLACVSGPDRTEIGVAKFPWTHSCSQEVGELSQPITVGMGLTQKKAE